ncbi:MAG: outer membrane protein assembly factor BamD [Gammaproteobacteria bacterium]|nr:outer membrane protein assembly factor BamD [Gammaproteobacteria bacterium]
MKRPTLPPQASRHSGRTFGSAGGRWTTALNRGVIAVALLATIAGCARFGGRDDPEDYGSPDATQQALYEDAQKSLATGNYADSIVRLERLEARFPFGAFAEQAQLELIFAHHMVGEHDSTQAAADRFIRLHPQHPKVDYAYYMRGLSSLARDRGIFRRFLGTDISRRDITNIKQAFAQFNELVTSFPGSAYAKDARQRMIYIRNVLAAHELNVASYYLGRRAYVAAANRARYVIENFSQTTAAPEALALLIEANWQLGLDDAAHDALEVLALNFPAYHAFDQEGQLVLRKIIDNRERSWLNMVTFGLLGRPQAPPPLTIRQHSATDQRSAS